MSWITTLGGKAHDFVSLDTDSINIQTIATVLSRSIRFGGHCGPDYTNAQHSCLVHDLTKQHRGRARDLLLWSLLHDAHEVYWGFGDVASPAKRLDPYVKKFLELHAHRTDLRIAEKFNVDANYIDNPTTKLADKWALAAEIRDCMPFCSRHQSLMAELPDPSDIPIIRVLSREQARVAFLERFDELINK